MTITIPAPAKVFTFAGAFDFNGVSSSELRGELWAPAGSEQFDVEPPDYSRWPGEATGDLAVNTVNTILHTHTPSSHVIIYGVSMGGETAIYKWLREEGPTSSIDPADVTFVSAGNPERPYTGVCQLRPDDFPTLYGGLGFPEDTPYTLIDIARQYDFYADHPASTSNRNAMLNIGNIFCPIHRDYRKVGLNDPNNVVSIEGNVTYITVPEYPLKMLRGRSKDYAMRKDQELRPGIEAAYTRPKAVPFPEYWGQKTADTRQRRTVACTPSRPTFWSRIR